jgi:transcription elongation factor GreA
MNDHEAITAEGLEALKAELERLEGGARQEIAARIQAARELGDLKENAEYHIAKEDQALLETKIQRLVARLRSARVVEAPIDGDKVGFGSTVHVVEEASGRASAFTLVGPTEADVRAGKLSSESPVARALMGRRRGERVEVQTPGGRRAYLIERVGAE